MTAHQRESSTCAPALKSKNPTPNVKEAEESLAAAIEEGRRLETLGSFEDVEKAARSRREAELRLKQARSDSKAEKRQIRELAASSLSAASWTKAVLGGEEARFDRAEGGMVEQALAAQTVGLVTSAEFRERREALEAEEAARGVREEEAERKAAQHRLEKKRARKRQREEQERRGLSFVEED